MHTDLLWIGKIRHLQQEFIQRMQTLVEAHCVLTRECDPLGFTELGESEPFKGIFSTNSTEHSQKRQESCGKMFPVMQSQERKRSTAPRPCHLYLFLEQKLSSVRGQAINLRILVKTHCKLEEEKGDWGCTPCEREKNMHDLRGVTGRWTGELSRPQSQSPWTQCLST